MAADPHSIELDGAHSLARVRHDELEGAPGAPQGPTRSIVHIDLDAFFAAVEVLENPGLKGKPVLVGGRGRGVVAAASYEAREYKIYSAMPMFQALRLCPHAVVVPPRHRLYGDYSRRVMAIVSQVSPVTEQISIDEAFIDLTGQAGPWEVGVEIARRLQNEVRDKVKLSASLGVATNKLVAKVASDRDKPGGLTVVRPGEEAVFLAPLPVRVLWGVGPVTARRLGEIGVTTVGQLAALPEADLRTMFGRHGSGMARQAHGIDRRPVGAGRRRKSVSQERTFRHDLSNRREMEERLKGLSQGVAKYLRRAGVAARTIAVKLRYSDFTTLTRQMRLAVPTDDEQLIYAAAVTLLDRAWERGRAVRLLGVAGRDLCPPPGQLPLLPDEPAT